MLNRFISDVWLRRIYIFLYATIAVFLPLNKIGLSIATLLLGLITLLFTPLSAFKEVFVVKKSFRFLAILFLWVILSLSWSKDFSEGIQFINLTLPFYILSFIFFLHPVKTALELDGILKSFLGAVTLTAIINIIVYARQLDYYSYDMRQMSLFISHIRLSIMVVIAAVLSFYFFLKTRSFWRVAYLLNVLFLIYYTLLSEVISGYISLAVAVFFMICYFIYLRFTNKTYFWITSGVLSVAFLCGVFIFVSSIFSRPKIELLTVSKHGNPYWSDTASTIFENGHPVGVNIQFQELDEAWGKRSTLSLDSMARNGQANLWNLIRYMASKGLVKDAEGVAQLTDQDIRNVEHGFVSSLQENRSFRTRLQSLADEMAYHGNDPNGYTFLQRMEYWKAGVSIAEENTIIGVGAGGARPAFNTYYEQTHSKLTQDNRRQSHQQFLSIAVTYGGIGLALFLLFLFFAFKEMPSEFYMYLILMILVISFLNEDTLETQTGASLVAFFVGLFAGISIQRAEQKNRLRNEHH